MDVWESVAWAIILGAMIMLLIPRTQELFQQQRETKPGDWQSVLLPLVLVIGFVILLVALIR